VADEVGKVVIGQHHVIDAMLKAIAVRGHVLLEGVPGVAKTLLVRAVSRALGLQFSRIQFTPDMLPSDVTGNVTLRGAELSFQPGPVFGNVVLADEINRTPPKTQAALLEAMQEGSVTIDGVSHLLPDPFIVMATQNPVEYEGTYPLPEAQLDRFLMKLDVGYPDAAEEIALLKLERKGLSDSGLARIEVVASAEELASLAAAVDAVKVADQIFAYTSAIVRRTRTLPSVELGASPRAAVHLLAAAKAAAVFAGRSFVTPDDVLGVAEDVLRHRLILRPEAEIDRYTPEAAVRAAIAAVPVPK
jgi:MoxR-like ATPase